MLRRSPITHLPSAAHSVTASYSGDAKNLASVSSALSETVNKAATNLGLVSSSSSSSAGQSVTFTATLSVVAPGAGVPGGTIEFVIDGSILASAFPISSGTASFSDASLSAGSHTIAAVYSGDLNLNTSTSSGLTHTVTVAPPASTASFVRRCLNPGKLVGRIWFGWIRHLQRGGQSARLCTGLHRSRRERMDVGDPIH